MPAASSEPYAANVSRPPDLVRRRELLDTVVRHLGQHGVGVSSLRGIAKELGVNVNVLVHHFGTRGDLLRASLDRALQIQLVVQERTLARRPRLTQGDLIRSWWRWATSSPDHLALARIGIEAATLPPGVLRLRPGVSRFSWQVGMTDRLVAIGLDRDTAETETARITALVTGLVVEASIPGSRRRSTRVLDAALRDLDGRVASVTGAVPTATPGPDATMPADPEGPTGIVGLVS